MASESSSSKVDQLWPRGQSATAGPAPSLIDNKELGQQMHHSESTLTEVVEGVAGPIEGSGVELEAYDGEDDDGEEQEESDVDQWPDRFPDRAHHDLKT